jgi:transcriptional regulator of arginine metabolism
MAPATASRRRLLRQLVTTRSVRSQSELVDLLESAGHPVTQATISRDLDAIGAVKDRAAGGTYSIPPNGADDAVDLRELARAINDFVLSLVPSASVVVVKTNPGAAHLVAGAIDRAGPPGVVGTVAGDDTLLVVAAEGVGAAAVSQSLERIGAQR